MRSTCIIAVAVVTIASSHGVSAQEPYRLPPQEIVDILDAPRLPAVSLDPDRQYMLLVDRENLPPLADLAAPMLRLAGSRINPDTNAPHRTRAFTGFTLRSLETGQERRIALPEDSDVGFLSWAPDGSRFAFTITHDDGVQLWVGDVSTARARPLTGRNLNPLSGPGNGCRWLDDSRTLLCSFIPNDRGELPQRSAVPMGPIVQATTGRTAPVRTFQDMLQDAHDEALYEHYFTAQLAMIDSDSGERIDVGEPALYSRAMPSPGGEYLLVSKHARPFSYLIGAWAFPEVFEIWDMRGNVVRELVHLPLRDTTPIQGVATGPRNHTWQNSAGLPRLSAPPSPEAGVSRSSEPRGPEAGIPQLSEPGGPAGGGATDALFWVEALDGGDPLVEAEHRDRVMMLSAPFDGEPVELLKLEHRYNGITWLEDPDLAFIAEYDRDRRWMRTWLYDLTNPDEPTLVWDRSIHDSYNDPGSPLMRRTDSGYNVALIHNNAIFLRGSGATPLGDRPFLDRLDLETLDTTRLWVNEGEQFETVIDTLTDDGSMILTRRESPTDPPNYFMVHLDSDYPDGRRQLTHFPDPAPQLRGLHREMVTYERDDGVQLSATLYLPPDHVEGERLPLIVWAYPREFSDPATAGQVTGSPYRFVTIGGSSHLFALTQGYAIMDAAAMPVIGDPDTMNDTFIEQIVGAAAAAIDYAVDRGVADRERVAVGGHSYGAFMTAHLLANSDLFRAGIARSGAFNRTLTPFGFQSERRTLWEAPESYFRLSPFMAAHRITAPLLLLHGQIDNNSGTFPMQSERMYHAIQGHGGTARLVMLPYESHSYLARESIMHVLAETLEWLDTHVKEYGSQETPEQRAAAADGG